MKKSSVIITGIIFILISFSLIIIITKYLHTTENEPNTTLIPIKIGYRTHSTYAPLFIGIEKGIFKKYGLAVEPIKFESTNQLTDALIAGRIDAALGGVNTFLLFSIEDKSPGYFKIFSIATEDGENPSTAIVVSSSSTINVADLNNKKIATYLGTGIKTMYERYIKANNLKNTTLMQMDPKMELPALAAGQVDAAFLLEPQIAVGTYKKISKLLEAALFDKYFMNDIPFAASIVSQKFINEYSSAIRPLVMATDESIDFIINYPEELQKILSLYIEIELDISSQIPTVPFQKYKEINKEKLLEFSNLLLEINEITKPINPEGMILPNKYVEAN